MRSYGSFVSALKAQDRRQTELLDELRRARGVELQPDAGRYGTMRSGAPRAARSPRPRRAS